MSTEDISSEVNNGGESPAASLTLRMIMQGKEAGSIIGKKGDNVKKFREESGAKINISDSSCPERIVTVTGSTDSIFKAFTMICKKFEEDIQNIPNSGVPKPPVTIRLIVPASQCGSLIGKGGSKIKEIREVTGASIQVASEMLPNSTERTVTISGSADSITQCIYHICCVMLESPPKGATIPYRPKPAMPPVIFAGGQAFQVQGQYAIPAPDGRIQHPGKMPDATTPDYNLNYARPSGAMIHYPAMPQLTKMAVQQGLLQQQGGIPFLSQTPLLPGTTAPVMGQIPQPYPRQNTQGVAPPGAQTHEMTIPNDLIGCIIGRGGAKINEIRQLSGATIKIANADEGSSDRKVTITGSPETINAAQYLINASIEMHKTLTLESQNATAALNHAASATPGGQGAPSAVSQGAPPPTQSSAQTLGGGATPPGAATHVSHPHPPPMVSLAGHTAAMGMPMGLTAVGLKPMPLLGLGGLPGMLDPTTAAAAAAAAVANRKYQQAATAAAFTSKLKAGAGTGASLVAASSLKSDQRAKFAPY